MPPPTDRRRVPGAVLSAAAACCCRLQLLLLLLLSPAAALLQPLKLFGSVCGGVDALGDWGAPQRHLPNGKAHAGYWGSRARCLRRPYDGRKPVRHTASLERETLAACHVRSHSLRFGLWRSSCPFSQRPRTPRCSPTAARRVRHRTLNRRACRGCLCSAFRTGGRARAAALCRCRQLRLSALSRSPARLALEQGSSGRRASSVACMTPSTTTSLGTCRRAAGRASNASPSVDMARSLPRFGCTIRQGFGSTRVVRSRLACVWQANLVPRPALLASPCRPRPRLGSVAGSLRRLRAARHSLRLRPCQPPRLPAPLAAAGPVGVGRGPALGAAPRGSRGDGL